MEKKKLEFIEGFKGFACLSVILSHFIMAFCNVLASCSPLDAHGSSKFELFLGKTPLNLFYNGNFGVFVFFVVSGFVLSYTFFINKDENYLKRGVIKRYFRLLLPIVVVNLFAFLLMKFSVTYNTQVAELTKNPGWFGQFNIFDPNILDVLKQAFFGNFFRFQSTYVSPLWTISYEIYGSFLVFFFLGLFGKEKIRYPLYIILILLLSDINYDAFIIGMMICDVVVNGFPYIDRYKSKKWLPYITFIVGIYFASYPTVANVEDTIYQIISYKQWGIDPITFNHLLGASLMVFSLVHSSFLQKIFELKPFRFLGKYSFGLYLVHWPIMISLSSYLLLQLTNASIGYYRALLMIFPITILVVFILAILLTQFVDKKGIQLANSISNFFFSNSKRQDTNF